jgi:hypothetical protein
MSTPSSVAPISTADPISSINTANVVGVSTLKTQIASLQTTVSTLQTQISSDEPTSLVNTITDLQTRVTELEAVVVAVLNN